jgi:fibronectin type 3 domain-containing protein
MFLDASVAGAAQPPAAPAASAGSGVVHLTWSPPPSDGGYAVQKYKLYRATTPGGEDLSKAPLVTLSKTTFAYDDTSVANGTTYHYVVVATNAAGTSGPSAEVSATPRSSVTAKPPGAPTGLTASSPSGGVHLAWSAPASDGGAPVSGYTVYRGTAAGAENLASPVGTSTTTSFDDTTSLTTGTTYYYVVTATNTAGEGPCSNEASATVTAGVPGEPTLRAQVQSGPKVALSWTVPPDGGSPITKYVLVRNSVRLVTLSGTPTPPTSYTDATPPSGSVTYQVKAVNAIGSGPLSSKVTVTVP